MFTPCKALALNGLGKFHGLEPGIRTSPTSHALQPFQVSSVLPYRYFIAKQTLPIRKCYLAHAQLQSLCCDSSPHTLLQGEQALCWGLTAAFPSCGFFSSSANHRWKCWGCTEHGHCPVVILYPVQFNNWSCGICIVLGTIGNLEIILNIWERGQGAVQCWTTSLACVRSWVPFSIPQKYEIT